MINMIDRGAIYIGGVIRHKSLAVAKLYSQDTFNEPVLTIDEAIKNERFSVAESGAVENLIVENMLDNAVFIASGMLVEGRSQNRYSVFPALVMPNSRVSLPVNCAQQRQGLIGGSNGRYGACETIVMPSIRGGIVDQADAWRGIENTTMILGRMDPTRDYAYADRTADIKDYIDSIGEPEDSQVGIVAGIRSGKRTLYYTDFFGNKSILARVHSKLAKSFGIVARVNEGSAEEISKEDMVNFLKLIEIADCYRKPHVGGGSLYIISSPIDGSVLAYPNATVQVSMRKDFKTIKTN